MSLHADGCHYFSTSYACACGAQMVSRLERDLAEDPFSAVWMEDIGVNCKRCRELLAGAHAVSALIIYSRDGTIELERVR
jgi:hypothetical protein